MYDVLIHMDYDIYAHICGECEMRTRQFIAMCGSCDGWDTVQMHVQRDDLVAATSW